MCKPCAQHVVRWPSKLKLQRSNPGSQAVGLSNRNTWPASRIQVDAVLDMSWPGSEKDR